MMMTQTFGNPRHQGRQGTFLASVQVFVEQMQAKGYAAASLKESTRLVKDFTAWLDQSGIEGNSLSSTHVADYLDDRWLTHRRRCGETFTLHSFVRFSAPDDHTASTAP